jgi:hypothetical protein
MKTGVVAISHNEEAGMKTRSTGSAPNQAASHQSAAAARPPSEYIYRGAMLAAALLLLWSANA